MVRCYFAAIIKNVLRGNYMNDRYKILKSLDSTPLRETNGEDVDVPYIYTGEPNEADMQLIFKNVVGDIPNLFANQYKRKNPLANSDFYSKIRKLSKTNYHQVGCKLLGEGCYLRIVQSCGGIEMIKEYQGIRMNPEFEREYKFLEVGKYILKIGDMHYVKAKITPKTSNAQALYLGRSTFDGAVEDVFELTANFVAQLRTEEFLLVSIYQVFGVRVTEGHAELGPSSASIFLEDNSNNREILPYIKSFSEVDTGERDAWFTNIINIVEEAFFQPSIGKLLLTSPRVSSRVMFHRLLITFLIISAIALEVLSVIYKWKVSFEFISYAVPVWLLGLAAFCLVFSVYASYLYYNPISMDTAFQPVSSKLSNNLDLKSLQAADPTNSRVTRGGMGVYRNEFPVVSPSA